MYLRGDVMDYPFAPGDDPAPRSRKPVSVWFMVAVIVIVLGGAVLAAAVSTDTRDFASRHHSVLKTQAL
jgi:hypothetical protein